MENLFPSFPGSSRVWIFQSDRPIQADEARAVKKALESFLSSWKSHGHSMISDYEILNAHFLIVVLNNSTGPDASGCGIDSLVLKVKEIGENNNIDFLNNANVAFSDGGGIHIVNLANIRKEIENGKVNSEHKVFINSVTNLGDLRNQWLVPVKESWVARYFKSTQALSS
jgi:hypothetical protein